MNNNISHVSRRIIGKVNVFDISGDVSCDVVQSVSDYIKNYIVECKISNVLLNLQGVKKVNSECSKNIIDLFGLTKKAAVFSDSSSVSSIFVEKCKKQPRLFSQQKDVVGYFGKELLEKDKLIVFDDRRQSVRMKTALLANIDFIDEKKGDTIYSEGIITNLSSTGLFAEYLDLKASMKMETLDYFKNLNVQIKIEMPNPIDQAETIHNGKILRLEFSGAQAGIAVNFND